MNAKEIRQWGEEIGRKYPKGFTTDLGEKVRAADVGEGVHNDNFGLAILQIQATLEVAAQVAELKDVLNEMAWEGPHGRVIRIENVAL